jgi:pimeloyl-ACP methyl ester carboxylesterase
MTTRSQSFECKGVSIEALVEGSGPLVVMIASLGRPAQDFDDLSRRVAAAGFTAIRPQPRGIGKSAGPMLGTSLMDLVGDVALVVERLAAGPAVFIGHAFGQRVGRMLATARPDLVMGIVMLAAGGRIPVPQRAREALSNCFDLALPDDRRIENIRYAFFAPGNDPTVWRSGWYPEVARMQRATTVGLDRNIPDAAQSEGGRAASVDAWWAGGTAPLLVIQGLQDTVALPENGRLLKAEFGDRVQLTEIDRAGHALLPEQPEIVATNVLAFLKGLHPRGR